MFFFSKGGSTNHITTLVYHLFIIFLRGENKTGVFAFSFAFFFFGSTELRCVFFLYVIGK